MEDLEVPLQLVVNVKDGSNVTTSVAVVGSRPNCNQVGVLEPVLKSVHDELMSSSDELKIVNVVEFSCNL